MGSGIERDISGGRGFSLLRARQLIEDRFYLTSVLLRSPATAVTS